MSVIPNGRIYLFIIFSSRRSKTIVWFSLKFPGYVTAHCPYFFRQRPLSIHQAPQPSALVFKYYIQSNFSTNKKIISPATFQHRRKHLRYHHFYCAANIVKCATIIPENFRIPFVLPPDSVFEEMISVKKRLLIHLKTTHQVFTEELNFQYGRIMIIFQGTRCFWLTDNGGCNNIPAEICKTLSKTQLVLTPGDFLRRDIFC